MPAVEHRGLPLVIKRMLKRLYLGLERLVLIDLTPKKARGEQALLGQAFGCQDIGVG